MESLWYDLGFLVIATDASLAEVLAALPVPAAALAEAPRRFALAEKIHVGDPPHRTEFAAVREPGWTILAPPGYCFLRTAERDWPEALSRRFGRVWAFSTSCAWAAILVFEDGVCVAEIEEGHPVPPERSILGVTTVVDDDDATVLAALGRLLGTPDVKAFFRRGTCTLCRAESGR
jgi:hypothetical protein